MTTLKFSEIAYKDINIRFAEDDGTLGYTFNLDFKFYKNKVNLPSRKRKDLLEAACALMVNAIETYEELCKQSSQKTSN